MPGAIWSGAISFGLVTVPVRMVSATRDLDVHFHQIDGATGERIEIRRVAEPDGQEVAWEEVGRGYDLDGQLVTVSDRELAQAAPERTHTIQIEEFVDAAAIDPAQLDRPYFLLPDAEAEGVIRAYRLLRDAMAGSRRVAIGRVVLRTNEYLVAVGERDGLLALTTMVYADEIRSESEFPAIPTAQEWAPSRGELTAAVKLVRALSGDFEPDSYHDRDRERVRQMIAARLEGTSAESTEVEAPAATAPAPDLMAALRASLERVAQR
ncbi:MAG: Ku protein [Solirubrobacteraceae bacterium]